MTRENKLALVVGFGLILFVGILISDHFSTARSQQAANLTNPSMMDPLQASIQNSDLVEMTPLPPTPAVNTTNRPVLAINETARPEQSTSVFDGELAVRQVQRQDEVRPTSEPQLDPNLFVPVPVEQEPIRVAQIQHEVKGGDTFFKICKQYYGDSSLASALAKFNQIDDPAALRAGRKLQIPPAELIGGKPAAVTSQPAAAPKTAPPVSNPPSLRFSRESSATASNIATKPAAAAKSKTYTVKSGDSLATIAHRHLGSKAKWKKVYDMNRDVIDDPHNVKVGTVLRLF